MKEKKVNIIKFQRVRMMNALANFDQYADFEMLEESESELASKTRQLGTIYNHKHNKRLILYANNGTGRIDLSNLQCITSKKLYFPSQQMSPLTSRKHSIKCIAKYPKYPT